MNVIHEFSLRHPRTVVLAASLLTLGVAPGILQLKLRTDGHALVPFDAVEVGTDAEIRRQFGVHDPVVVAIQSNHPDGLFNTRTLSLVQRLTQKFLTLPGVRPADLFSLDTETNDRVFTGTLRFRRFLEPLPETAEDLATLKADVLGIRLYNGTLVSSDQTATAVIVGVPDGQNRHEFFARIHDMIDSLGPTPETLHVIGAPVAEALLGHHILEDLGVPSALLGYRSFSEAGHMEMSPFPKWHEAQRFLARRIGMVPAAIALMGVVFFVFFRSVTASMLPLIEVGACLLFVFGAMGWLGVPVYLTIAVMPVILTATGVTDEIHFFSHYAESLVQAGDASPGSVMRDSLSEMTRPIVMTSVTTAIGFLSFALSPIAPVQAFGLFTALGITFCMSWTLVVLPALLVLVDPKRIVSHKRRKSKEPRRSRWLASIGRFATRRRGPILVAAALVVLLSPFGLRAVVIQDSWIDGFAPDSDFHRATTWFNEQFLGTHTLLVCVDAGHDPLRGELSGDAVDVRWVKIPADAAPDAESLVGRRFRLTRLDDGSPVGPPTAAQEYLRVWKAWVRRARLVEGDILLEFDRGAGPPMFAVGLKPTERLKFEIAPMRMMTPETLWRISELERFIENRREDAVGGVIGTADYVSTVNFMSQARRELERKIPHTVDRIEWIWKEFDRIRTTDRLRQLVDATFSRSLITVLMKDANFVDTQRLMDAIRDYERTELAPHGLSLSFAGDVAVSQTLIRAIVHTQVTSIVGSIAGDLVATAILSRSLIFGLLCVLPSSLAVLVNFAAMGILGIPLGVATSMFSAMTIGIGVDYAIHLLSRYRLERMRGSPSEPAMATAVRVTGSAIFIDTLAVCLGFGVLLLSQVPANARLGGLLILSLANCFLATILILPALIARAETQR